VPCVICGVVPVKESTRGSEISALDGKIKSELSSMDVWPKVAIACNSLRCHRSVECRKLSIAIGIPDQREGLFLRLSLISAPEP
jgi:hypothetical protein